MLIAALVFALQANTYTYDGPQQSVAVVVDQLRKSPPPGYQIELVETIPMDAKSDLKIKSQPFDATLQLLETQTPVRFARYPGNPKQVFISWSGTPPAKGAVRLYQQSSSYFLEGTEISVLNLVDVIKRVTGFDSRDDFSRAGIALDRPLAAFKSGQRKEAKSPDETGAELVARILPELAKPVEQPLLARRNWNLTFLPGNPPDPGTLGKIDFTTSGPHVSASVLAAGITAAYAPKAPVKAGEVGPKPDLVVSAVGNTSLVLEGRPDLVNEVRRLLATQIDVPQSQILLELDTYQVSSNAKGRDGADRAVRQFTLGQEIARMYKTAHYAAIQDMLIGMDGQLEIELDKLNSFGLKSNELFGRLGMATSSLRKLAIGDVLALLAYSNNAKLNENYPASIRARFDATHVAVQRRILGPIQELIHEFEGQKGNKGYSDDMELARAMWRIEGLRELSKDLTLLNDSLSKATPVLDSNSKSCAARSALLQAVAKEGEDGKFEDRITRRMLEEFMILWVATADEKAFSTLAEGGSKPTSNQISDALRAARVPTIQKVKTIDGANLHQQGEAESIVYPELKALLQGDRTARLTRASERLDDLMLEGVQGIQQDSENLVDRPLQLWIDKFIVEKKRDSRFGVRFGGTTKLAVTSRSPGRMGSEQESFFPSQPVAPLSLGGLIPALSRTAQPPAADATDATSQLLKGGMSPMEAAALQAVFDQASKPPYERKLGTGLNFSVLPTMLPNGSTARLQVKLNLAVAPDSANNGGARQADFPGPVDLIKSSIVETELLANAFDITQISSLKVDVTSPSKRDWEFPILSQILPIRSWFVGPTQDRTVRHEAIVLIKVAIVPCAMDLASRSLDSGK